MYRPPLTYKTDYLYEAWYENIDYAFAYEWFRRHTPVSVGACSTVRKGNLIGRNLDWTYDENAEFIVHTYDVVGVANAIPGLTDAFVKSYADADEYRIVPFMLSDGMNKHGLVVTTLVVPTDKGDNSVVHPLDTPAHMMCTLMLPRYVLDHFQTAIGAVSYFRYSISLYHPKTLQDQKYDQHFVIADANNTYCMEFVDGRYAIKEISDKPFVTNFHLHGVTFNADGSVNTPASGKASDNGITDNGSGLERYNLINDAMSDITFGRNIADMAELMEFLSYTRAYQSSPNPASPRWDTEFVGTGLTVDSPTSAFDYIQSEAARIYTNRSRILGDTWQTVHSVVYDVQEKKLHLYAQENYDTQWEVSVMAEQTHIQRLRGTTVTNDRYTGLNGETTVNTDSHSIRIHDGYKRGGYGTIDSAHYDGDLPATVPTDLRTGAHVTQGSGHLDGGISTTAESLAGNGLIAAGGALDVDVDNLAGDGLLSTGDALAVDLDTLDGRYVKTAGNEYIDGKKTFLASPLVPTPPLGDSTDAVANTAFIRQSMGAGLVYNNTTKQIETQLKVATQDMTFYVRKTGSDDNDGLTEGTAFLTVGKALEAVMYIYFGACRASIDIGAGTFDVLSNNYNFFTTSNNVFVSIRGAGMNNTTLISDVELRVLDRTHIIDLTIKSNSTARVLYVANGTLLELTRVKVTSARATQALIWCHHNGAVIVRDGCVLESTGAVNAAIYSLQGGSVACYTITFSGNFTGATVISSNCGVVIFYTSVSGTVTGKRYNVIMNGVINTNAGSANFIPGTVAGTTASGGQYY